jgi:ABC-type glycerol-3-phosphate transport system substrate-binding protein
MLRFGNRIGWLTLLLWAAVNVSLVMLAGCQSAAESPAAAATAPLPTETVLAITEPPLSPTAAPQPTPQGPMGLVVWWPEPLAPLDNETAAEVLSEQLTAFQHENDDLTVEFRLKRVEDVGGIMSTLRTASAVAPGALPDLTLLRREDLATAVETGLIQPLGDRLSPAVLEDMQEIGLELGRIGGSLYGVPYTLEIQHSAYPLDSLQVSDWSFDGLLENRIPFLFSAGRTNGINQVLMVQYLAAGGELSAPGDGMVSREALETTLAFYEAATEAGLVTTNVLEFAQPSDYTDFLASGDPAAAVITSTLYLQLTASGVELGVGPIPTATGSPVTLVDGWMWVLTTDDPDRQERALRFLDWMLDAERQAQYMNVILMLPSQRTALRQMADSEYGAFVVELLTNAILPQADIESGAVARAMQNALALVITDQRSAGEAAQDVLAQFQ